MTLCACQSCQCRTNTIGSDKIICFLCKQGTHDRIGFMGPRPKGRYKNMIPFPDKKYKIIYADPPWEYDDKALAGNRGACCKYDVMSEQEINKLPVNQIAADDSILFLWATFPKLPEAFDVIKSWGFTYKTKAFTWVKTNKNGTLFMGMGGWTRSNDEVCLLATKGKPSREDAGICSVIMTDIQEHSEKPDIFRTKILQLCGDLPRIELFARTRIHGWDTWGNDEKLKLKPLEAYSAGGTIPT